MSQPTLAEDKVVRLIQLLDECVAGVEGWGTAFFIRHDLLLTCTHVVEGHSTVRVRPFRTGSDLVATVMPGGLDPRHGDLSLLKVEEPDPDQPAVLLYVLSRADLALTRKVKLAGYPRDDWSGAGYEPRETVINGRWKTPEEMLALTFDSTAEITRGMSGGPVFDHATGTVVGISRYQKGTDTVHAGGGAVPVGRAIDHFPEVRDAYLRPPDAVKAWLAGRTQDELQIIGRGSHGAIGRLDLHLNGTLDQWWVGADDQPTSQHNAIRLDALGVNVSRAVFQWTRGRRTSSSADLDLVGDILSAALLHGEAGTRFHEFQAATDHLTVRLIADPGCELADLPWEYAKPSRGEAASMGVDERLALVRVLPGMTTGPSGPAETAPKVIAVAVQPEPSSFPLITTEQDKTLRWPAIEELAQWINDDIPEPFAVLEPVRNPPRSQLRKLATARGPCAVVHYQGFAQIARSGKIQIAAFDESTQDLAWVDVDDFVKSVQATGAKLVVIEHSIAPHIYSPENLDLCLAGLLLKAGVPAVLTTRFPVHPLQARIFNQCFYQMLAASETVERAVQAARRTFADDEPVQDRTSYGAFVLWTGELPDLRIVAAGPSGAAEPGSREAPVTSSTGQVPARSMRNPRPEDTVAAAR